MNQKMHIKAIDWAISKGYFISVTDMCADVDEWDVKHSQDRKELIDACEATEIPNVWIHKYVEWVDHNKASRKGYKRVAIFSVIDDGIPDETICDYTPAEGEFNDWWEAEASAQESVA